MVRVDEPGEEDLSDWHAKYKPQVLQLALYWPMKINWIVTLKKKIWESSSANVTLESWAKEICAIHNQCVCVCLCLQF